MPIYEYEAVNPKTACPACRGRFELLQSLDEKPIKACPKCGNKVKKVVSLCHAAVVETPEESARVERQVKDYESAGMWSHAAELADKHSEKTKNKALKMRALDNYKKAGYDADSLDKHAKQDKD
jgi:putative FmdB family regulatory protein